MAGINANTPFPTQITLHQATARLALAFDDGLEAELSCEFLRVYSPSAEVRGHGPGQEVLQYGKQGVRITHIEPVGNYAIRLVFSDGHDSGIYSWDYLHELASNHEKLWQDYLQRLTAAGGSRDPAIEPPPALRPAPAPKACGRH